jgi:4-hydroxy-tetrahydrodipicolinate reductase
MTNQIPVIVFGLGPIGRRIAVAAQGDPLLDVIGAVDVAPDMVGKRLSSLQEGAADVEVVASLAEAIGDRAGKHLTVLHATGSYVDRIESQFHALLDANVHVVSTCEELSYPFARHPEASQRLHEHARSTGRTLVGTGINPGFLMDLLPVSLTGATHAVQSIEVTRMQNPRRRRIPFQRKVGCDISRAEYDERAASGSFGHVGLIESGRLIAAGMGWQIDDWTDTLEPVQPDPNGNVLGTRQVLSGASADGKIVNLHFEAQSGVEEDYDETKIDGTPPLHLRFIGGVFGDDGTAAAVLRATRCIPSAPRGLVTVLDLPLRARPE